MKLLFNQAQLSDVFANQTSKALSRVEQLTAPKFQAIADATLVAEMLAESRVAPVQLVEGAIGVTAEEAKVDISEDHNRVVFDRSRPHFVSGIVVSYYVPFSGEKDLFRFQPSTFSFHGVHADVRATEVGLHYRRADTNVAATKAEFDSDLRRLKEWLSWVNRDVEAFNVSLADKIGAKVGERRGRLSALDSGIGALGIPIRSAAPARPIRKPAATSQPAPTLEMYDVALSFAGEDRPYVEEVALALRASGVNVFYDSFEKGKLWGKNLIDHLADVYQHRSRFVVMFVSQHYVAKAWPTHERQHAQARALVAKGEFILPARFDDTEVPGMTSTVGYVDLRTMPAAELADLIKGKLA